MKVVVIGGTGRVGSALVAKLLTLGHEAVAGSPKTGVDALTAAARYFGAALSERSLVPLSTFVPGATSWRTWLDGAPAPVSKG